jgi:hypothetical protein
MVSGVDVASQPRREISCLNIRNMSDTKHNRRLLLRTNVVAIFLVRESDDGAMDERFGRLEGLPK